MNLDGIPLDEAGGLFTSEGERFAATDLACEVAYALGGRPIVWEGQRQARPLTLYGDEQHGWLSRATMEALQALATVQGAVYLLTLDDGNEYRVRWRHEDPPVIDGQRVIDRITRKPTDWFKNVQLKFQELP